MTASAVGDAMMSLKKVNLAVCLGILLAMFCYPATGFSEEQPSELTTIERKVLGDLESPEPGTKEQATRRAMEIYTSSGPYSIIDGTQVTDANGKIISMDALPVPCEAEIVYQPLRSYRRNALEIHVKNILPKASKKWSDPIPQ